MTSLQFVMLGLAPVSSVAAYALIRWMGRRKPR